MKFKDIRVLVKTGGGREMTVGRMFEGMAQYIKDIAGESGQTGVTEEQVNQAVSDAVDPVAESVTTLSQGLDETNGVVQGHTEDIAQIRQGLASHVSGAAELSALVEAQGQHIAALQQKNNEIEGRLASLEAAANGN